MFMPVRSIGLRVASTLGPVCMPSRPMSVDDVANADLLHFQCKLHRRVFRFFSTQRRAHGDQTVAQRRCRRRFFSEKRAQASCRKIRDFPAQPCPVSITRGNAHLDAALCLLIVRMPPAQLHRQAGFLTISGSGAGSGSVSRKSPSKG